MSYDQLLILKSWSYITPFDGLIIIHYCAFIGTSSFDTCRIIWTGNQIAVPWNCRRTSSVSLTFVHSYKLYNFVVKIEDSWAQPSHAAVHNVRKYPLKKIQLNQTWFGWDSNKNSILNTQILPSVSNLNTQTERLKFKHTNLTECHKFIQSLVTTNIERDLADL
jgi:hypothetical protein